MLDGAVQAISHLVGQPLKIQHYQESALRSGSDAPALALVEVLIGEQGRSVFGAGIDSDIATASIKAVLAALARA